MQIKILLIIMIAVACLFAQTTYELRPYVIDNGGNRVSDGTYTTYYSIGQAAIGYQFDEINCNWTGYITNNECPEPPIPTISGYITLVCDASSMDGVQIYIYDDVGLVDNPVSDAYGYYESIPLTSGNNYNIYVCHPNASSIPVVPVEYNNLTAPVTNCDFQVVPFGDLNCDGDITTEELREILRVSTEPFDPENPTHVAGNTDCEYGIGTEDLRNILGLSVGMPLELSCCPE